MPQFQLPLHWQSNLQKKALKLWWDFFEDPQYTGATLFVDVEPPCKRLDMQLYPQVAGTLGGESFMLRHDFIWDDLPFGEGRPALGYLKLDVLNDQFRQSMEADRELGQILATPIEKFESTPSDFLAARKKLGREDKLKLMETMKEVCESRIEERLALDGTLRAWNVDPADEPAEPPVRMPSRLQ